MYDRHKLAADRPVHPRQHGDAFEPEPRNQPQTFSFVCRATEQLGQPIGEQLRVLLESVGRLTDGLAEIRDLLVDRPRNKEWYSTHEVAEILAKRPYTVRNWCRMGRVRAEKIESGRGVDGEWRISHEELTRIRNEGLLPLFPRR